jgi:hypothetical protein
MSILSKHKPERNQRLTSTPAEVLPMHPQRRRQSPIHRQHRAGDV